MLEKTIEGYLVERVKELGGEIRKVKWIGRNGAPDRIAMRDADKAAADILRNCNFPIMSDSDIARVAREIVGLYTFWLELKAPGEKCRPHQIREHERMRRMGQTVLVLDSFEGVDQCLC